VLTGFCSIAFTSMANSVLQLESSPQMRGRVMAFWTIAVLGSSTLGGPVVGWVGQTFGAHWALALGGLAAVAAAGLGAVGLRQSQQKVAAVEVAAGPAEFGIKQETRR